MITSEAAVEVLYTVLCTEPYQPRGYYTIIQYKNDPLYTVVDTEFIPDPIFNRQNKPGPAA